MKKLETKYLGLTLKSPIIVSSSGLTSDIANLRLLEDKGAGCVVLKSLFEEQIMYHISEISNDHSYPEANDYISRYVKLNSIDNYLGLINDAKWSLSIPVIPSINCFTPRGWTDFAARIEDAGADALEVNAFFLSVDRKKSSSYSENLYFELAEELKKKITIPIVMKIGFRFSNILYIIDQLYSRGINGIVMFNRFYEPDIDIEQIQLKPSSVFSNADEMKYVLRWIAMASAQELNINISASSGVNNGEDVVKYLLAGADTVQVCSALYKNGIGYLETITRQLADWMTAKNFNSIEEFRGRLNQKNANDSVEFERFQFMKYFSSID
jgi:dihydroorotate dehydrogenase (fumarate)